MGAWQTSDGAGRADAQTDDTLGSDALYPRLASDDGAKRFEGRHPFSVGLVTDEEIYLYIAFGVFVAVAGGAAFTLWRQGKLGFKIPDFSNTD